VARPQKNPWYRKNSALAIGPEPLSPPVIKILPSCNNADAAPLRGAVIDPAASQFPIAGCVMAPFTKIPAARITIAIKAATSAETAH